MAYIYLIEFPNHPNLCYVGKTTRNAMRDLKATTDSATAKENLPTVLSKIDKLAKKGVIHKNKAANLKSSLTKTIAKMA